MEVCLSLGLATVLWKYNKFIAGFLILSVINMHYPLYDGASFYAGKMIFLGCLWYYFVVTIKPDMKSVFNALCFGVVINLFVQCLQIVDIYSDITFALPCSNPSGLMSNPNETAALYVFCIPCFLAGKWWKTSRFTVALPIIGLYFSRTDLGGFCLVIAIMVILFKNIDNKYAMIGILVLWAAMIAVLLYKPFNTLDDRIKIWTYAADLIKEHWVLGAGLGHWKRLAQFAIKITGTLWETAHNEYLQAFVEMGIGSVILIAGYLIDVLRRYWDRAFLPFLSIVLIAAFSFGSFPWHIAPLAMISITMMGLYDTATKRIKKNERKTQDILTGCS